MTSGTTEIRYWEYYCRCGFEVTFAMDGRHLGFYQAVLAAGESMGVPDVPCKRCGKPIHRRVGKSLFQGIVVAFLAHPDDEPDIAEYYFPLVGRVRHEKTP